MRRASALFLKPPPVVYGTLNPFSQSTNGPAGAGSVIIVPGFTAPRSGTITRIRIWWWSTPSPFSVFSCDSSNVVRAIQSGISAGSGQTDAVVSLPVVVNDYVGLYGSFSGGIATGFNGGSTMYKASGSISVGSSFGSFTGSVNSANPLVELTLE